MVYYFTDVCLKNSTYWNYLLLNMKALWLIEGEMALVRAFGKVVDSELARDHQS